MMNPMNHMTTHFSGYGEVGGGGGVGGGHHTGPGPGSPAQQQQQLGQLVAPQGQQQQQSVGGGPGGPLDGINGGFRMQQQQPGPGPNNGIFQPQQQQQPGQMEPQQQRSMMGSNVHMAGGQVVANNMMNGSSISLGPSPMNGMMNIQQQMPQQQIGGAGGPNVMPSQQQMMQQQQQHTSNPHMGVHLDGGGGGGQVRACAGCGGKILERFLFHALDRFWHHGCLKCTCCGARLADIGVSCYTKAGMILCRTDYVRLFGSSGACSACGQGIPANELVMRVGGMAAPVGPAGGPNGGPVPAGVYHVKCFACTKCQTQLMPGDRYGLVGGSLLCEQDCHQTMKVMKNNNNNNNSTSNNNNQSGLPAAANTVGGTPATGGGGPVRKGKVGRPRRSRD